ncbi:MAG: translational GTPase TypA [Cytophagales bacterium]|nr:translational GTPase TypA [Armatimonadota bacterium]
MTTATSTKNNTNLRNIAIIAHVDHGKTTLLDGMLRQGGVYRENQEIAVRVMDRMDQEKERGITIVSKHTAITHNGHKINVVDTPGHADFGGEVERVMLVVDGVLLLVDAVDGPMPQTRFVLEKALQAGHKAVVVVNKIDRPDARPDWVIDQTFDLFAALGATDEQLDFPIVYAIALEGKATTDLSQPPTNLQPLFETIVNHIPAPKTLGGPDDPVQALISTIDGDPYLGRLGIGKVFAGSLKPSQAVTIFRRDATSYQARSQGVFVYEGLKRVPVEEALPGDIIAVTGLPEITIGETIATGDNPQQLPAPNVDEPTLQMTFGVNTSPFTGREGQFSTSRKLRERLMKELETNVSLKVQETDSPDSFVVFGRGELHLAVLIEAMRREGYELQVSMPQVIFRTGENGQREEPYERVLISVDEQYQGAVMEALGSRRGELLDMRAGERGGTRLEFVIPTRGLLGFRSAFLTLTRGTGVLSTLFEKFGPWAGEITRNRQGSLIASETGQTTAFGLFNAEERGELYLAAGVEVYEGMIVGRHQREGDLEVNVCKMKQLTNMRSSNSDVSVRLTRPIDMSLDRCIEQIGPDDLLEVTPRNVRMRKRELDAKLRRRSEKQEQSR